MGTDQADWSDAPPPELGSTGGGAVPSPEELTHLDELMKGELSDLSDLLRRYLSAFPGGDPHAETFSVTDERALGRSVAAAAQAINARAKRRRLQTALALTDRAADGQVDSEAPRSEDA